MLMEGLRAPGITGMRMESMQNRKGIVLDLDIAGGGEEETGQHPQGGCLSRTVWSQQSDDFALFNVQTDLVHGTEITIIFR